jgi:hypothetical protein
VDAGRVPVGGSRSGDRHPPASILRAAGLTDIGGYGIQAYLEPDTLPRRRPSSPSRGRWHRRSIAAGIATDAEIGLDTLLDRLTVELRAADAIVVLATLAGAFGRRAP